MFKVSFKENSKKVQVFNDKATVVTLTGRIRFPNWFSYFPKEVAYWITHHPTVDYDGIYAVDEAIITVSGKSVCSENDSFNPVLGERIAESRAKIRLYKFMYTLCKKLMIYYYDILYGVSEGNRELHTAVNPDYHGGLEDVCQKYSALWIKESQHLGKLLDEA